MSYQNNAPPKPSLLTTITSKYRLPAGLIFAALGSAPDLMGIPWVTRYEVWGAVAIFCALVVTAHFTVSRVALAFVLCVCVACFITAEVTVHIQGESDPQGLGQTLPRKPVQAPKPLPQVTHVGDSPSVTVHGLSQQWVLHEGGDIDRLNTKGQLETTFHVTGPAAGMTACGGAVIVTHDEGKIARVSPTSGKVLVDYPYGTEPGPVSCAGGFVWAGKGPEGSVVQMRRDTLDVVDDVPLVNHLDDLTYGRGVVWVFDRLARQLVGLRVATKERLGPYAIGGDAQQIIYARGSLWILHRKTSCLKRFDLGRRVESTVGVPLGRNPWRMGTRDGLIYVADYDDGSVVTVDAESAREVGRPVVFPTDGRLTDIDAYGGRLVAIDSANATVITLGAAAAVARLRKRSFRATAACPR